MSGLNPVVFPSTVIIGARGFVGRHLFHAYRALDNATLGTDWMGREGLARLDLADPSTHHSALGERAHAWAVICAGVRDYTICEQQPAFTRLRNVEGTLELARLLSERGAVVIFLSSDAVYGGDTGSYTEEMPLRPNNHYARQKADVERGLPSATAGRFLVLRCGRVVGRQKGDGTLLDELARKLAARHRVKAARDQIFNAVLVDDIPRVIQRLQVLDARGTYNLGGPEAHSRLSIAQKIAQNLHADAGLVEEITVADIGDGVPRPRNLSMRSTLLYGRIGWVLTPLSQCIDDIGAQYRIGDSDTVQETG